MQEIAPGGFQIMWSASALLKTWRSASGGEDPIGYLFLQKVYHELGLDKICRTWCY